MQITKWRKTHGYREQTDSCQRGGDWGLGDKGEGLKQRKKRLMDKDNSMVIAREKGEWEDFKEGKGEISGDGRRLDLGVVYT